MFAYFYIATPRSVKLILNTPSHKEFVIEDDVTDFQVCDLDLQKHWPLLQSYLTLVYDHLLSEAIFWANNDRVCALQHWRDGCGLFDSFARWDWSHEYSVERVPSLIRSLRKLASTVG